MQVRVLANLYTCTSLGPNQSVKLPAATLTLRGSSNSTAPDSIPAGNPLNLTCTVAPSRFAART